MDQRHLHLEHDGKLLLVDANGNGPKIPIPGRIDTGESGWIIRLPTEDEVEKMGIKWNKKRIPTKKNRKQVENALEYSINSGVENGINDPEYLRKVDDLVEFMRNQPKVTSVRSYTDVVKRLNQNFNNDDQSFYKIQVFHLDHPADLHPVL